MKLGNKIRVIRLSKGMTTAEFGKLVNATKGTISKWENDKYQPNPERIKRIADIGGITVEELIG